MIEIMHACMKADMEGWNMCVHAFNNEQIHSKHAFITPLRCYMIKCGNLR